MENFISQSALGEWESGMFEIRLGTVVGGGVGYVITDGAG